MKLNTNSSPIEMSSNVASSSFSIAMNAKAFKVLSDTLYQNKIGSIVREISCNAFDSHIQANKKEVPFVIHLPDAFEPWFAVQDHGIGLSPDNMVNVFTKYFESTKNDSNSTVGAYGIGCKCPYSYTDQFTITSIYNGTKTIYSAFITEQGIPSIAEMDSSPTHEHNGVEIKMSVRREDYSNFANETAKQLRFFTVKPTILNKHGFQFENIAKNIIVSNEKFAICSDTPSYNSAWAHIIQGNVGYPLDINQVKDKVSAENKKFLETINGTTTYLYFDIGKIGVTASREGVEYNKYTIANIDAQLNDVRMELIRYVSDSIDKLPTNYVKASFLNSNPVLNKLARASDITIPNLKANSNGQYSFDFSSALIEVIPAPAGVASPVFDKTKKLAIVKEWTCHKSIREVAHAIITPRKDSDFVILLRDTANRPNIRAKHLLSTLEYNTSLYDIESTGNFDLFNDAFIKQLIDLCGGYCPIMRISELPLPEKDISDPKIRVATHRPTYYSYTRYSKENVRQWDREFDNLKDLTDEYVYVEIDNMTIVSDITTVPKYESLLEFADPLPLIGIRRHDLKKIDGKKNFIKYNDYVDKLRDQYVNDKKLKIAYKHSQIGSRLRIKIDSMMFGGDYGHYYKYDFTEIFEETKDLLPTRLSKFAEKLEKKRDYHKSLQHVVEFIGLTDPVNYSKLDKKIKEVIDKIHVRYPLLKVLGSYGVANAINKEHLIKYLKAM